mmetsp:Transcript_59983/g.169088  ORF Transcript_59983/g.169088 Transcript_59983/m.169088 type:complete len:248 (-) Transcript_59983:81-824(-)
MSAGDGSAAGGILGRFENVRNKTSNRRLITCEAATPEYIRHDFLKPQHLPLDTVDQEVNYSAACNIGETKFHKGFQRRNKVDIQPDAARLQKEFARDLARDERAVASVEQTLRFKEQNTFNILTGEGTGREGEFRQLGKKIINPAGAMESVNAEHTKDASHRIRNSKHRFHEHPAVQDEERSFKLYNEGLPERARQSAVLGYGSSVSRRTRTQSCGVADNFAHLRALPPEPPFEQPHDKNMSRITFG